MSTRDRADKWAEKTITKASPGIRDHSHELKVLLRKSYLAGSADRRITDSMREALRLFMEEIDAERQQTDRDGGLTVGDPV